MDHLRLNTVLCCIGTRPELIKMAPVVKAFQRSPASRTRVLLTAQHRSLVDQMLHFFDIHPDIDLNIMQANQSLPELTARLLVQLDSALADEKPDIVLAQGDTTTVFTTALACFYRNIPFAHVEAGLRTHNLRSPFPEEANRLLAARLSALHFAPTPSARGNLLREGIYPDTIHVVGNPVIDALLLAIQRQIPLDLPLDPLKRMILVTAHRRESFGQPLRQICHAVASLTQRFPNIQFLWPLHPNPSVKPVVECLLGRNPSVLLCDPLEYGPFVTALSRSHLVLTDSGGLQEEAPALGKPVLVMRENSERPEAIWAGVAKLVGTQSETIVSEVASLLQDPQAYASMSKGGSPYGDGNAADRIAQVVTDYLATPAAPDNTLAHPQLPKSQVSVSLMQPAIRALHLRQQQIPVPQEHGVENSPPPTPR